MELEILTVYFDKDPFLEIYYNVSDWNVTPEGMIIIGQKLDTDYGSYVRRFIWASGTWSKVDVDRQPKLKDQKNA